VLVALCLTMVLGIAVIGYVAVCARTMEMSNRSFCTNGAVQLAEIGAEEALWTLNQARANPAAYDWAAAGWTKAGSTVNKSLGGFFTNQGVPGAVSIQIDSCDYDGIAHTTLPVITASGASQMPDGLAITKQLKIKVRPAALFTSAVGAYNSCSFTINWSAWLDSYESTVDPDPASGLQTRRDEALVNAPSVAVNAAQVSGFVATTGSAPAYTTGGKVTRADTPGGVSRDPRYVFTNASQNLFEIVAPSGAGTTVSGIAELKAAPFYSQLGTAGATTPTIFYVTGDLSVLSSADNLTINGPVIIRISGNLTINGTGQIIINKGADAAHNGSAQIFVGGRLDIEGAGVDNKTKLPKNLATISTSSGSYADINYYTAQLATSGAYYGVIYVPYGSLRLYAVYGSTTICGAVLAQTVDQGWGNGYFHYDLSLRDAVYPTLNTPYDVSQWLVSN